MSIEHKRSSRKQIGIEGERFAKEFVERSLGWQVIAENWRCRNGEVDLIAMDGRTLVIIEVRTRQSDTQGTALESVDERKVTRLVRLAKIFVHISPSIHGISFDEIRLDVIGLYMKHGTVLNMTHLKGAIDHF